jgi:hypothetical protein
MIGNVIQKSSRRLQGYTNAILDSKAYTPSKEQRKQAVATRLSRIHSMGYWIPTHSIKTEMHLGVDAYAMVRSWNSWCGARRCGGARMNHTGKWHWRGPLER